MQHSVRVRNAFANALVDTLEAASSGARPQFRFYTGTMPASCALARTGSLIGVAEIPAGYQSPAAGGVRALAAAINGVFSAIAVVGYYSIVAGDGQCDEQGSVSILGGGADCELNATSLSVVPGQPFSVTLRSLTGINP